MTSDQFRDKALVDLLADLQLPGDSLDGKDVRAAYRRASDICSKAVSWLWPGRLAGGKLSIIAGNPGLGKSQLALSIAAIVSTGTPWPDGTPSTAGQVVILSAEDDPEDTIRPRLEAAGANLDRIVLLDGVRKSTVSGVNAETRTFDLRADVQCLDEMIKEIGGAALVVIDPISAYLGSTDSHRNSEVRALLAPLAHFSATNSCAIVGISHLNKSACGEALFRVSGSLAFVAAARAAYLVGQDPDDDGRRLFLPLKNNLGNDKTGLAFRIEESMIEASDGQIATSRAVWSAEEVTTQAADLLRPVSSVNPAQRGALEEAQEFLCAFLADGPALAKHIREEAEAAGISKATLRRASKALRVEHHKAGMTRGWSWSLPRRRSPISEGAQFGSVSSFGKDEHLRPTDADANPTRNEPTPQGDDVPRMPPASETLCEEQRNARAK